MRKEIRKLEEMFFNKLADKLEELFPKYEKCQCGKRLKARSKALSFNAFANLYLKDVITEAYDMGKQETRDKIMKLITNEERNNWDVVIEDILEALDKD